jgi:hypothetical protein
MLTKEGGGLPFLGVLHAIHYRETVQFGASPCEALRRRKTADNVGFIRENVWFSHRAKIASEAEGCGFEPRRVYWLKTP